MQILLLQILLDLSFIGKSDKIEGRHVKKTAILLLFSEYANNYLTNIT